MYDMTRYPSPKYTMGCLAKNLMNRKHTSWTIAACAIFALSGCSDTVADHEKKYAEAILKEDMRSASIELKAILQKDRGNLSARQKLATLHERTGDLKSAEKELYAIYESEEKDVLFHNLSKRDIQARLARVYSKLDDAAGVESLGKPLSSEVEYIQFVEDLKSKRFDASAPHMVSGIFSPLADTAQSLVLSNATLKELPLKANWLKNASADVPAEQLTAIEDHYDLLSFYASIRNEKNDDAVLALSSYVKRNSWDLVSSFQLVQLLFQERRFSDAKPYLDTLYKSKPEHALVNEMKSIEAYESKEYEAALKFSNTALLADQQLVMSRVISAFSSFHLKKYDQALIDLDAVVDRLPPTHPAKRLHLQLKAQDGTSTAEQLTNIALKLDSLSSEDVMMLSQLGMSIQQTGDSKNARLLAEKVGNESLVELDEDASVAFGMLQMSLSDPSAMSTLENAFEKNNRSSLSANALVTAYLNASEWDKAKAVASKVKDSDPYQSKIIEGLIALRMNDYNSAVEFFTDSLTLNPAPLAGRTGVVESLLRNGKQSEAIQFINSFHNEQPSVGILKHFLSISGELGGDPERTSELMNVWLSHQSFENDDEALLLRGQVLFSRKMWPQLSELLKKESLKKYPEYWLMRIATHSTSSQDQQSLAADYKEWLTHMPDNKMALMGAISTTVSASGPVQALVILDTHAKHHQDQAPIELIRFHLQLLARDFNGAQESFSKLPSKIRKSEIGVGLEGILMVTKQQFKESIPRLETLYSQIPSEQYLSWLYYAYEGAGDRLNARRVLNDHLRTEPNSSMSMTFIANLDAEEGKFKSAEELYIKAYSVGANNALLLNNLAFTQKELGKLSEAEESAKKALSLVPGNENILETLASIYLAQGSPQKSYETLSPLAELFELDSTAETWVKTLNALGQKNEANAFVSKHPWQNRNQ